MSMDVPTQGYKCRISDSKVVTSSKIIYSQTTPNSKDTNLNLNTKFVLALYVFLPNMPVQIATTA